MREVVTVQVGGFANYVGSHFWNFQDELLGLADDPGAEAAFRTAPLDMDVLYRTGETLQGVSTYCPRLVSVGSRGSLGSLSSSGTPGLSSAAPDELNVPTWSGNVTRSVAKPHGRNLFLQSLAEDQNASTSNGGNSIHVHFLRLRKHQTRLPHILFQRPRRSGQGRQEGQSLSHVRRRQALARPSVLRISPPASRTATSTRTMPPRCGWPSLRNLRVTLLSS